MNFFQATFDLVDRILASYVSDTATNIISFISPIFTSLLIVWIAIWGYLMMFGKVSEPLQEGVFRILRVGFIMALGLTIGTYTEVVVKLLSQGPEELATVVTGGVSTSVSSALDSLFSQVFEVSESAWHMGGILDANFGMYLIALLVLAFGGVLTCVVAFLILLSKVMTTVLLAIGPLFIVMLLFNATQRFFEAWLGMVVNQGLILILGAAIGKLMISLADIAMDSMSSDPTSLSTLADASILCLLYGLCIMVVKQVPSVAAALGGGVALATQGALGTAMSAMRPTNVRRQYRHAKRDVRTLGGAVSKPYHASKKGYAAYQKRFGSGNVLGGVS
ncbi:TPA: type IV secretion system protein [Vibrio parahaemolyticus]|uniref:type IV secretion system protein n=2 Tax=Vibrio parahaemolyticus TaxID=670 RepID=UPI00076159C6|nr:type IV secretion system protein [Vibrio parahaemolyticus]KWU29478.1 type IV secretion protein [Vibrio parahaemolyticus]HCE4720480.1 type IV secretion system protein [Vibrio parahaemolyticus]HCE4828450.1 type IV secretion system protein [Vibrio parahaemolyticus]HCE5279552.1 type IV secretion system protein [Vibrio parahaemolyticus]HCG8122537.1 type IV secretion system protein [Vibrio parahaemolyticus]